MKCCFPEIFGIKPIMKDCGTVAIFTLRTVGVFTFEPNYNLNYFFFKIKALIGSIFIFLHLKLMIICGFLRRHY